MAFILIIPILIILLMIGSIFYCMYAYYEKIKRGRTVRVRSDGKVCSSPLGSLPVIPEKFCKTGVGSDVLCYSPPDIPALNFSISKIPRYYRSVCIGLCTKITINGSCEEENELFNECISLLEPPDGCVNTARPLGRLEGTSDIYYASELLNS